MAELYRHYDADDRLLYVGISYSAALRTFRHAQAARYSDLSFWFDQIVTIKIERFRTRREALAAEVRAIREEGPVYNVTSVPRPQSPGEQRVYTQSPERRAKVSLKMLGHPVSEETRRRISKATRLGKARAKRRRAAERRQNSD